jgi:(aminoalkyl)phosphonate N-acetyltransferase
MEKQILIRYAGIDDHDDIYNLICDLENQKFDKEKFKNIFVSNLNNEYIIYKVLEINGKVSGFVSLYIQYLLHHCGKVGEIEELIIDKQMRGMSLGEKLIENIKEEAIKADCVSIEVTCSFKRDRAHVFYQKNGFDKTHFNFTGKLL